MEAKEGGGGSSREGGGSRKADLRAEPRGNREPVPAEAEAAGKVAPGAPGFPAPSLKAAPPARGALPNPFLALGVRLREATGQSGGIGNTEPKPSRKASRSPLCLWFAFCLRLYAPTPASSAVTPSCQSGVDGNVTVSLPGLEAGDVGTSDCS